MSPTEKRTRLEKRIVKKVVSSKTIEVFDLGRGYNGRILSFSPYSLRENTNASMSIETHYAYGNLSRRIHSGNGERSRVERKIEEILPTLGGLPHEIFVRYYMHYDTLREYCNAYDFPMLTREKFNQLKKLVKKWRILSAQEHYSPTKQEKRKLKKLLSKNK